MFSKTCQYAIRAVAHIARVSREGRRSGLTDIAAEINAPAHFTAKVLQQLAKDGIILSMKGPNGGFEMTKDMMRRTRLSMIVEAIDGDSIYRGCGLGLPECSAKEPCPVHDKFVVIRNELRKMLEKTTVNELSEGLLAGLTCLKR